MHSAWWSKVLRSLGAATKAKRQPFTYSRLRCELLEDRTTPTAISWAGTTTSWNTPGNWSTGTVPTATDDATIVPEAGAVTAEPILDVSAFTHDLTVQVGATLIGGAGFTLTVGGNFGNAGVFDASTSTVLFDAAAGMQTLDGGSATFADVTHNGAGVLQLLNTDASFGGAFLNDAGAGNFDANGQGLTITGLTTLTAGSYLAGAGTQNLNGGLTINGGAFTGAAGVVNAGDVTITTGTLTAPSSAGTFTVSGSWSDAGTFDPNGGTVDFNGTADQTVNSGGVGLGNDFNNLTHSGSATLQVVTNDLTAAGTFTNSDGTTDINGKAIIVSGFTLTGGAVNDTNAVPGAIASSTDYDVQAGSVGAVLTGVGVGLTKTGGGTVTLGAVDIFTGATTVNAGTLLVNGTLAPVSAVAVNNNATLGGTGAVGAVTVNDTGRLAPGASPGILHTGAVSLGNTANFDVEVNGTNPATPDFDQLLVTGSAALGGATLNLTGSFTPVAGDSFTILSTTTGVTGTFNNLPQGGVISLNGVALKIDYLANGGKDVVLSFDSDVVVNGTAGADDFNVALVGANVVVKNGATTVLTAPLASLTSLTINGLAGNDTLTVDYSAGFFALPITFHGGDDSDKLIVTGGTFANATHTFTGPDSGNIVYDVDGNPATTNDSATISYDQLEPVDMTGSTITDLVFNLPGANDQAILEDDAGGPGNGFSQIRSQNGAPTFETTTFADTVTTVTVNMGGDAGALTVGALPDFTKTLIVNGQAGADTVNFTGADTFTALTVNVNGAITNTATANVAVTNNASFTGGTVTLGTTAGDAMNFGSLTYNSAGAVTISEDSDTSIAGTNTAGSLSLTSAGTITDAAGASQTITNGAAFDAGANAITLTDNAADVLSVGGNASFNGSTITIAAAGTANFGSLTYNSGGAVAITADSATAISGANTADSLTLTAAGAITDAVGTSQTISNGAAFDAGANAITLTDNATDTLSVGANASFNGSAITIAAAGTANFASLTYNSGGAVAISEDSATNITGTNTADSLTLTSAGAITDDTGASQTITNGAAFNAGANAITLTDNATDVLSVGANASFSGSTVTIAAAGAANFGSLTYNSGGAVSITEDSATNLSGASTADSLSLTSAGAITDAAGTSQTITNGASFDAGANAITLTDNAADTLSVAANASFNGSAITVAAAGTANFGSLTYNSGGAVSISEDSALNVTGTNTADSLALTAAGAITDAVGTSQTITNGASFNAGANAITLTDNAADTLSVGANASFSGSAVTIAAAGTANFASLTYNSTGAVSITEDSATNVSGTNTASSLSLTSAGAITDAAGTSQTITNGAAFDAGANAITLTDNAADTLSVGANASFNGSALTVAAAGAANFGSLTYNSGGAVSITEDSATNVTGTNTADSLSLTAAGAITDAAGTSQTITNGASFNAGANAITLTDNAADTLSVGANASFSGSAVTVAAAGTANFATLTYNATNAVAITEDSATTITSANTAGSLSLTSAGAITDAAGTSQAITNGATFDAGANAITLTDNAADVLTVGSNASFNGSAITIAAAGTANFGTLTFSSTGTVSISENSAMNLAGASSGNSITLASETSTISDDVNDDIADVTGSTLTLSAVAGIGVNAAGSLDVDVDTVASATSATGGIALNLLDPNNSGVTVTLADATTSGDITLTGTSGSGTRTYTLVDTNSGNINVSAAAGDLSLGLLTAGTGGAAGTVTVTATAGQIIDDANDATADIIGSSATLSASTGIGQGANGSIDLNVNTLTNATAPTGGIALNLLNDAAAANGLAADHAQSATIHDTTTTGNITLTATAGAGTRTFTLTNVNAAALSLTGGTGNDTINLTGVTLTASSSIDGNGGTDAATLGTTSVTGAAGDGLDVSNLNSLGITASTFSNNAGTGLSITNGGTDTISGSTLNGNARGLALNGGTLTIDTTTINGNTLAVGDGAGINVASGSLTLNAGTSVANNTATAGSGGGLFASAGTVTLNSVTFNANSATIGGGLDFAGATATLQNVTVSGNTATTTVGGGIAVSAGTVTLTNVTVANNTGDGVTITGGAVNTTNSLFASNSTFDFNGAINTNGGFNLFQNSTGKTGTLNANDILDQAARLAPLGNYGGLTLTHALLPGSFALDTGTAVLATDQRGIARPVNGADDIGAFESQGFVVTRVGLPETPAGDTAYRGLITTQFLGSDGATPLQFAASVSAVDPNLTDLTLGLTPDGGGVLNFIAPTGAVASVAPATQAIPLTFVGGVNSAQTTMTANAVASLAGTPYSLFATTAANGTVAAPGPGAIDWKLFNQKVTTLSYAASGFVFNTPADGVGPITIVTTANHLLATGQTVTITGVQGNDAANGTFTITVTSPTSFTLNGTVDTGLTGTGGIFAAAPTTTTPITTAIGDGLNPIKVVSIGHHLTTGQQVTITGVAGFASANGTFTVTVLDANTFTLSGPHAFGAGVGGTLTASAGLQPQNAISGENQFGGVTIKTLAVANIVSATEVGNVVTLTTTPNGLTVGQVLAMSIDGVTVGGVIQPAAIGGIAVPSYNGTFLVTVVSPTTLTYTINAPGLAAGAGGTVSIVQKNFFVTLLDQDNHPVDVTGQSVSLDALVGGAPGGVLNSIGSAAGFPALTSSGDGVAETTVRGIVGFTGVRILKSTVPNAYQFNAQFTNPTALVPDVAGRSSNFNVVPLDFTAAGGNFGGAQQTVLSVTIVPSLRGDIRLVERPIVTPSGVALATNQLLIQAFDVGNPASAFANGYSGPVVITFNVNVTIGLNPTTPANTPIVFTMTNGELLLSDVVVETALGDFTVTAQFTLADAAGVATVSFDTLVSSGQFVRSNVGRQRGR